MTQPTSQHFNMAGHGLADLKVIIIEKVKKYETVYRREREHYLIKKFNTYHHGFNRKPIVVFCSVNIPHKYFATQNHVSRKK